MKPKLLFPIETVIEGNLGLQTVNRTLQNDYKIYNPNVKLFTTEKFISSFNNWPNNKKENFIKIIIRYKYRLISRNLLSLIECEFLF